MKLLPFILMSVIFSVPTLSTSNFKGTPPLGAFQSAYTVAQYDFVVKGSGPDTEIDVECWMLQNSSWINWSLPQLKDTAVLSHLLIHEQGHFNLAIVFAKRLKQESGKIDLTNPSAETPRLLKIKQNLALQMAEMNDKYELETRNGREKSEQSRWNSLISEQLSALDSVNVRIYFK